MDRFEKGAVPDRQDGERMDSIVQTRDWTASGGGRKTTGDQGKLTASLQWRVPEETSSLSKSEPSGAQHSVSTNVASVLSDASLDVSMSIMFDVSDSGLRP
jgi:hypothetical protein